MSILKFKFFVKFFLFLRQFLVEKTNERSLITKSAYLIKIIDPLPSPASSPPSQGCHLPALSFRPRRHSPMLSAFCRLAKCSTCKAAPPLPKNLAPLRFSGALIFELRSRTGLARCVSNTNAFLFHAFTLFKGEGGTRRLRA